jgi:hypothetical protein
MRDLSEYAPPDADVKVTAIVWRSRFIISERRREAEHAARDSYDDAWSLAHAARPTLLALERLEAMRALLHSAWVNADPPLDWACWLCRPSSEILVKGWKCWWHAAQDLWPMEHPATAHRTGER